MSSKMSLGSVQVVIADPGRAGLRSVASVQG